MRTHLRTRTTRAAASLVAVGLALLLVAPAQGAMTTPRYTKAAEPLATYVGQTTCSPTAKPGVVRFSQAVMKAYPGTGTFGIVRACAQGGKSEHKEGRAWDWKVNAAVPAQRAAAHDLMRWLFATDAKGVRAANARRVGLMYLIFDRQIWSAYAGGTGWRRYTGANPHTDHMHLSFSWSGARAQTSWFAAAPVPVKKVLPTPARTAPLPAPRPLPKVPVAQPVVDHDHEGGWRPGKGRPGDDAASRAAARAAAEVARDAREAAKRAAKEAARKAAAEKRAAEEAARRAEAERRAAAQRAALEAELRAAHAAAVPLAAQTAAAAATAEAAHAVADAAEDAQEEVVEALLEQRKEVRRWRERREAVEVQLAGAVAELARLRAVEDAAEDAWRTARRQAERAADALADVVARAARHGVALPAAQG